MTDQVETRKPATPVKDLLFYILLLVLSLAFFATVRNNTFWHSSDYLYLLHAIKIDGDWREIFAQAPLNIFQPFVNGVFYLEYRLFGLNASGYYLFNIFVHSLNAYLVYRIVYTLLRDGIISVLSSLLFACAVGNYGKAVMVVSGINDLLITFLTLITLFAYFKNELTRNGNVKSIWFLATLLLFTLSLLSKTTSFSILGCMFAFNFFFRAETKRPLFGRSFVILAAFAFVVLVVKLSLLPEIPGLSDLAFFSSSFLRNFGSYLVRMVFPIHASDLVRDSGPLVRFIYAAATEIRVVTFLFILSYSVFGFVFGNRVIRFFIAWTYITVVPFCMFKFPSDWLNISYLYLVSVGFVLILASGTVLAARLLYQRPWRRFIPYLVPLYFVFLSQFIIQHLDRNYERLADSPSLDSFKTQLYQDRSGDQGEL